jgi:hypothetical protein
MLLCVRTTIRMDDQLFTELKKTAAAEGRTLASVIEDALRESLARRDSQVSTAPFRFPTFHGTGLAPGVNPDDLFEVIDQDDAEMFLRTLEENS